MGVGYRILVIFSIWHRSNQVSRLPPLNPSGVIMKMVFFLFFLTRSGLFRRFAGLI
jgi:hypothetical protein